LHREIFAKNFNARDNPVARRKRFLRQRRESMAEVQAVCFDGPVAIRLRIEALDPAPPPMFGLINYRNTRSLRRLRACDGWLMTRRFRIRQPSFSRLVSCSAFEIS